MEVIYKYIYNLHLAERINHVHGSVSLRFLLSQEGSIAAKRKGMVLPFEPLSLTFDDIKYYVNMPKVSIS